MTIADYERAFSLWESTPGMGLSEADSKENIARFLERNPGLSLVAEKDGRLVGTVLAGYDGRRGYLHHLAVAAGDRRGGIGRRLAEQVLSLLREQGMAKCHLFIFASNAEGQAFWRAVGWQERQDIMVFSRNITTGCC